MLFPNTPTPLASHCEHLYHSTHVMFRNATAACVSTNATFSHIHVNTAYADEIDGERWGLGWGKITVHLIISLRLIIFLNSGH